VTFRFNVDGADFFNCEEALTEFRRELGLDGMSSAELSATLILQNEWIVSRYHTTSWQGDEGSCAISILVERQPEVWIVKTLLVSVLVVYGGLISVYLHPADFIADRLALIITSMLIIVTNMQSDLGLGSITYIMFVDFFNLLQIFACVIGMVFSVFVHYLFRTGREGLAVTVDLVGFCQLVFVFYPISTIGFLVTMIGSGMAEGGDESSLTTIGWTLFSCSFLLPLVYAYLRIRSLHKQRKSRQRNALAKLANAEEQGEEQFEASIKSAFDTFDVDDSGSISSKELRKMITAMYPGMSRGNLSKVLFEMRKFITDGEIQLEEFKDALAYMKDTVKEILASEGHNGTPKRTASRASNDPTRPNGGPTRPSLVSRITSRRLYSKSSNECKVVPLA